MSKQTLKSGLKFLKYFVKIFDVNFFDVNFFLKWKIEKDCVKNFSVKIFF